LFQLSLMELEK